MSAREAQQPQLVRVELRVGNRSGPVHADGRRGHIFAEGEVDEEWPRWFSRALRQRAVPAALGPFYVYAGAELELIWTNASTSVEEVAAVDAQRASELAAYGTVANALTARRSELERLDQRVMVMQEQLTTTESRVARLQQQEEVLERGLADERKRVAEEKLALAADAGATREMVRKEKQQALDELSQLKRILMEDMTRTVTHITGLSDGLLRLEATTATNLVARRSLGHSHMHEALDQIDAVADAHRLSLGGEPRETAGDRIANAVAGSIESGQIINILKELAKAVRGNKKGEEDED